MEFIIIIISKLYVMHNTTDKAARGEVSLHARLLAHLPLKRESGGEWRSLFSAVSLRLKPPLQNCIV